MDGGFPFRAFEKLRQMVPFTPSDLSHVAIPFLTARNKLTEGSRLLGNAVMDPSLFYHQARNRIQGDQFQKGMAAIGAYKYLPEYTSRIREVWKQDGRPMLSNWNEFLQHCGLGSVPLIQMDHHIAHAAAAYFTSGWDDALLITCDGVGALKSSIVAVGRAGKIKIISRTFYPHSPGEFWEVITAICGFHHMKHGGKITGLAALGNPQADSYEVMKRSLHVNGMSFHTDLD